MTVAQKLTRIAENEQRVYDAGYEKGKREGDYDTGVADGRQAEYDAFWDAYQDGGNRVNYNGAFYGDGWNESNFRPKYDMKPDRADAMFRVFTAIRLDLVEYLASLGVDLDFSECENFSDTFSYCYCTRIGTIDTRNATSLTSTFANSRIVTIDNLILKEEGGQTFSSTFRGQSYLENLDLEGNLTSDIDLHWSTRLTRASIESVYYAALGGSMDHGTVPTLTFSLAAVNAAYESAAGANDGSESAAWQALVDGAPFTISLN